MAIYAQLVSPSNPFLSYSGNDYFIVESTITNNTQTETQFFWKRTINNLPIGWETAICDPQYCRVVAVDTATFILAAGAKGKLDCNFYLGPNAQSGTAIVELELYAKKTPEKKVMITYTGQGEIPLAGSYMNDLDLNQKFSILIAENTIEVNSIKPIFNPIAIECIDGLGNTTYHSENVEKLPFQVPIISMKKGLYFVKIWSNSENYWCKKIVMY